MFSMTYVLLKYSFNLKSTAAYLQAGIVLMLGKLAYILNNHISDRPGKTGPMHPCIPLSKVVRDEEKE